MKTIEVNKYELELLKLAAETLRNNLEKTRSFCRQKSRTSVEVELICIEYKLENAIKEK